MTTNLRSLSYHFDESERSCPNDGSESRRPTCRKASGIMYCRALFVDVLVTGMQTLNFQTGFGVFQM
jgi:hypothetical protein